MRGDPYWLPRARFGVCAEPGCKVELRGKRAFYYPRTKTAYCENHGKQQAREFAAAAQDEDFYQSQFHRN